MAHALNNLPFRGQGLTRIPCCSSSCPASWAATGSRTCSITGGEFKSSTRTTSVIPLFSCLIVFLLWVFPVWFARALKVSSFSFSFYAFVPGFAIFFSSFIYYAITVCFLTCCLHALLVVFISACYVVFTCLSHIVAFIFFPLVLRFSFLGYSLVYSSYILSHCRFTLGFLYHFLVTTWSRFLLNIHI